jgi:nucleotide-binding universal stress UspA family protein
VRLLHLKTIVAATDLDASSHIALGTAHRLARASGAVLHVVHVRPEVEGDGMAAGAEEAMRAVREALDVAGVSVPAARVHIVSGAVADALGEFADRVAADVIVVGPHRERDRVTGGHTLGGTARQVVERASAPCLIAASPLRLPLERVLVPTDLSDTARGALLVGLSWASALRLGARESRVTSLTALHVTPHDTAHAAVDDRGLLEEEVRAVREGMGSWAGIDITSDTDRDDDVARAIGRHAREHHADLVVIGTRGRGAAADATLGSVSAAVTLHVPVPTLLVPPSVWRAYAEPA